MEAKTYAALCDSLATATFDSIGKDAYQQLFPAGYVMPLNSEDLKMRDVLDNLPTDRGDHVSILCNMLANFISGLYSGKYSEWARTAELGALALTLQGLCNTGRIHEDAEFASELAEYCLYQTDGLVSIFAEESQKGKDSVLDLAEKSCHGERGLCDKCGYVPAHEGICLCCGNNVIPENQMLPEGGVPDTIISITVDGQPTLKSSIHHVVEALKNLGCKTEAVSDILGVSVSYVGEVLEALPDAIDKAERYEIESMHQEKETVIGILQSFAKIAGNPMRQYLMEQAARELEGLDSEVLLNHFKSQGE